MSVKIDIGIIKAQCLNIINKALTETGQPVRYERGEADGGWGVTVNPDLSIELFDYAEGAYPPGIRLGELPLVEIAYLTEAAAEMLGEPELKPWEA